MFGQLFSTLAAFVLTFDLGLVSAFDITKNDNLVVYWGQDSANNQQNLAYYCQDDTIDVISLAFLYDFRGKGGMPVIDMGAQCSDWASKLFSGTNLANCPSLATDIKTCQNNGKLVTLSLGGAESSVGFSSDSQAQTFADQIWNLFLGGSSYTRPFGSVVLDGVDLDIENGSSAHYAALVAQLRTHFSGTSKNYYVTAAPQCPYPDEFIGAALNVADFDAIYVQFYNNDCELDDKSEYNFATWDKWAKTKSLNKDVKVYIGALAATDVDDDTGYVPVKTLANYASQAQQQYSSFGGVMLWDVGLAYTNNRFDKAIKTAMVASAATA